MNVLLIALGSHGDVHPFVGIAIGLKARGHHVTLAANEYFKQLVDHAQIEFISIGTAEEYRTLATNPDLWNSLRGPQAVFSGTARYLRLIYDITADYAKRPESIIAASTLAIGARVAQDKLRIPLVTIHLSPSIFQSDFAPPMFLPFNLFPRWTPRLVWRMLWRVINKIMDAMIAPSLNALRAELGLGPVRSVIRDYWHSPQLVIGLFPDWFAPPQPDWPAQVRLTGFPLYDEPDLSPMSLELIRFIDAGEPPIAFTPGSAMWKARRFFENSMRACERLGRRGLLLTRHRDHIPSRLPSGVIHVGYAPFSKLLPRCAAFVHHGGIGSSAQALAAGVPQLVTPFAHDQPDNADRLKRLGVAEILKPADYDDANVAAALRRLINSDRIAARCAAMKEQMKRSNGIETTCDLIEQLRA